MRKLPLLALAVSTLAFAQDPPLSPSIEADADYLLTTQDFMSAQFGMAVDDVQATAERVQVTTTGAEFVFTPAEDILVVNQRLGKEREAVRVSFPAGLLSGLATEACGTGAVRLRNGAGTLRIRINGDSLLMLKAVEPVELRCEVAFEPASARQYHADRLLLDEWGCVGTYCATGEGRAKSSIDDRTIDYALDAGQIWWLSVGPPRPYPWEDSFDERVAWHWSMETGYPSDDLIEQWSKYANILLQQAEVMLWKDWSLRFIPRNGIEEFQRVNETCERFGMRNIVYTSPYYFLTGTGLESMAMNSFDNFAVTGFSPGDPRGLNWPIFLSEITRVVKEYKPDGLYFDGIYGNVVRTYLISRKSRELVGDDGILEFHATGSPPGGGVYLPQIDTYYTFILRGEGCQDAYTNPDYMRYFVSTHNISNSIGVLCNNNNYPLDEQFVNFLLDNNIRLHFLGAEGQRFEGMQKYYWPALNADLPARVEAKAQERQEKLVAQRREMQAAMAEPMSYLPLALEENFDDPSLSAKLPQPAPQGGLETALPGGWTCFLSPRSEATVQVEQNALRIDARAHTVAAIERDLPADTVAVQCRVWAAGDFGMSWGPGLALWIGDIRARIGVRSDGRIQTDRAGSQELYDDYPAEEWYWLRVRIARSYVLMEASRDGETWECLRVDWLADPTAPKRLVTGKVPYDGGRKEHAEPGGMGTCFVDDVKVFLAR